MYSEYKLLYTQTKGFMLKGETSKLVYTMLINSGTYLEYSGGVHIIAWCNSFLNN